MALFFTCLNFLLHLYYLYLSGWFWYNISSEEMEVEVKMIFIRVFYYTRELSICGVFEENVFKKYVFYHIVMIRMDGMA